MTMLQVAALLFAIAAVGGLILAAMHFTNKTRPWALTILHGLLAATALVLLAIPVLNGTASALKVSLITFVVAALGGFYLFSYRVRNQRLPSAVVVIHALVAVVGFVLLLVHIV